MMLIFCVWVSNRVSYYNRHLFRLRNSLAPFRTKKMTLRVNSVTFPNARVTLKHAARTHSVVRDGILVLPTCFGISGPSTFMWSWIYEIKYERISLAQSFSTDFTVNSVPSSFSSVISFQEELQISVMLVNVCYCVDHRRRPVRSWCGGRSHLGRSFSRKFWCVPFLT
jgi:hypothetical protein